MRLGNLETLSISNHRHSRVIRGVDDLDDGTSTIVPERRGNDLIPELEDAFVVQFTFDQDLSSSKVYRRARKRGSAESLRSSAAFSFGWSCLSEMSLGDISNISVISLPIHIHELSNQAHYRSGPQAMEPAMSTSVQEEILSKEANMQDKDVKQDADTIEETSSLISSSPSIEDDGDIDFDLVYALHTFVATVEGQITVKKGEVLVLLDDSVSYWWLVRSTDGNIGNMVSCHWLLRTETDVRRLPSRGAY